LRLFTTHHDWTQVFLAAPTVLGVIDTYGIELIHPIREGRSPQQIGRKGVSNHRWIVGGKLCLLLNQWGLIVGWDCATADVADNTLQWLMQRVDGRMIVLSDTGFHTAEGDPANLKLCQRGEWQDRMLVETVLSRLTLVCHLKKVMHRGWASVQARLAFTMAVFNVLVQCHGLQPYASGFVGFDHRVGHRGHSGDGHCHMGLRAPHCTWRSRGSGSGHGTEKNVQVAPHAGWPMP
jgi:hypothetical protein